MDCETSGVTVSVELEGIMLQWKTTSWRIILSSSYSNFAEKNFPSWIQGIKIWSLSHRFSSRIFSSGIQSSWPSGESIKSPLNSVAVKVNTYQSLPLNLGNINKPHNFGFSIDNPDS